MDKALLIGLVMALGFPALGFGIEGGAFGAFASPTAVMIVFGGTIGSAFASFPMSTVMSIPTLVRMAFNDREIDYAPYVSQLVDLARFQRNATTRRELEEHAEQSVTDPFLSQAVRLIAADWPLDSIANYVETELQAIERRHEKGAQLFESMGGYSPTFGILGTVMGLVNVLGHLDRPEDLGPAIAVAFVATLFGVGAANILYLPLASKLKRKSEEERHLLDMLVDGVFLLQQQTEPPRMVQALLAHVPPDQRDAIREANRGGRGGTGG